MSVYVYIAVMAILTYLIRMIPLTVVRGKIRNRFIRSFLYYVPYACLMAMTFPSVFHGEYPLVAAAAGVAVALLLALKGKSLMTVALASSVTVFLISLI